MAVKHANTFSVYDDKGLCREFSRLVAALAWVQKRRAAGATGNYFVFNSLGRCVSSSRCERCGGVKPIDQSCLCFDNGGQ